MSSDFYSAQNRYREREHHRRYQQRIEAMARKLVCQACRGAGEFQEDILDGGGGGPRYHCGWCEGTGYVTPWTRGLWLRTQRHLKRMIRT